MPRQMLGFGKDGEGLVFTFTVAEATAVALLSPVTVTEYEVAEDGDTVIKLLVDPLFQW